MYVHRMKYYISNTRKHLDAYAACTMYLTKTDSNKMMVYRAVERNATDLSQCPQGTTPIEILARTQSQLLYQLIRLFDGDVCYMQLYFNPSGHYPFEHRNLIADWIA